MNTIILQPEYVLPFPRAESLMRGAAVAVVGDRIDAVADAASIAARYPSGSLIELPGCMLMPGLVNAHQHGRGLSQIQLGHRDTFLESWIAGRSARGVLDPYAITRLAAARIVSNGVTTAIHANYSYGTGDYETEFRAQCSAYESVGLRVTMCVGAMDRGSIVYPPAEACFLNGLDGDLRAWLTRPRAPAYAGDGAATLAFMERVLRDYQTHPLLRFCYGPAGPQWVSDELWSALSADAKDKELGLHLHALESPAQRDAVKRLYPNGAFQHLDRLGALGNRTVVAHGVWVTDADMDLLAERSVTVVRNPGCNIRMRNGIAPLAQYLNRGVRMAIGTDNCSLMDDEDLISELRLAGHLARETQWSGPRPPQPNDLLAMATTNGAVAAQYGTEIGTLEKGKLADIVAFSLTRTREPWLDPDMPLIEAFLSRAQGIDAELTMVGGRILYQNGRYTDHSLSDVAEAAAASARKARSPPDVADVQLTSQLLSRLGEHYAAQEIRPKSEKN